MVLHVQVICDPSILSLAQVGYGLNNEVKFLEHMECHSGGQRHVWEEHTSHNKLVCPGPRSSRARPGVCLQPLSASVHLAPATVMVPMRSGAPWQEWTWLLSTCPHGHNQGRPGLREPGASADALAGEPWRISEASCPEPRAASQVLGTCLRGLCYGRKPEQEPLHGFTKTEGFTTKMNREITYWC